MMIQGTVTIPRTDLCFHLKTISGLQMIEDKKGVIQGTKNY